MAISRVKSKLPGTIFLASAAFCTAIVSGMGWIPSRWVENLYVRHAFPSISRIAGKFADAVPFSWLDVWILAAVGVCVYSVRRRNWRLPLGLLSLAYLIFFW